MRNVVALTWAACLLLPATSAFADADLFKKSNCMACHAIDSKRLGPSMKEVSAKYKGDAGAAVVLAKKIQTGGAGVWGQLPMPPQPQVSDADAKKLVAFILALE